MTRTHTTLIATAMLTVLATSGLAEDSPIPKSGDTFTEYGMVEDWTIYADSGTKTCLVERVDDAGNVMQMGVTKDRDYAYVGIFTQADIDVQKEGAIAIAVDGAIFVGTSDGIKSGKLKDGYSGGYVLTNNPEMVTAIAEGYELVAFPERPVAFVIDLTGTKRAIEEARKCNAEIAG
ncbi:hypothetical protein [Tropicimonas sp. IMCC6043]|uniref:hypothetical protein n=1 Tax=Tropicimonas sp. IMCC6043 TaxID=2510645 RepID=UPI00101DA0CC|nr:hypothetical protein [Tropicimonas sp. IMCC6043]RYH09220.1 hypothetical protein EU800_13515 [Tropicimonas sp. IMCC6043]